MKTALKIALFRMWAAGAVCFFAAWGRAGPQEADMNNVSAAFSLNLIGGLVAIMVLCDIIIVNPIIRMASGKRVFGEEKKGTMFFLSLPFHFLRVAAIMALIIGTYYFINVFFIRIFSMEESAVPVPLEPFLFGIMYGLYYLLFETAYKAVSGKLVSAVYKSDKINISS